MIRDEFFSIVEKELKDNPKATSTEIAKKYKIPLHIVELYKKRIPKVQK